MREATVILAVVAFLLLLTAFRYRKQLKAGREVWRMLRSMRENSINGSHEGPKSERLSGNLLNCSRCGTWVPEERAIRIGSRASYCSKKCLEGSAVPG